MRRRSKPKVDDFEDIGNSCPRRATVFRVIKAFWSWMSLILLANPKARP